MKKLALIPLLLISFLFVYSCDDDDDDDDDFDGIETPIEDIDPYYFNTIEPIMNQSCATSGCHDATTKADGIELTSFDRVKDAFVDEDAWEEITSNRMPVGNPLSQSDKDAIEAWIESDYTDGVVETPATYVNDIAPLINQSCATSYCHDSGAPSAGLDLSTYALVKTAFSSTGSSSSLGRIKSGNMPKNGTAFTQTQIDLIENWIDNGFIQQ